MLIRYTNYNQDRFQENFVRIMKERIDTEPRIKGPRPLKADLHLHTAEDPNDRVSYTAKELISKAADQGFEVLAITNHQCLTFNQRLSAYARERGILLIPGMEINVQTPPCSLLKSSSRKEGLRFFIPFCPASSGQSDYCSPSLFSQPAFSQRISFEKPEAF